MSMRIRLEQFRQARSIHGGLRGWLLASLVVRFSRLPIPWASVRRKVFGKLYGGKYPALNENELEKPLVDFRSINELFARGVRPELRPVCHDPNVIVSPVDGCVQDIGRLQDDTVLTVKGLNYVISSLCPEINIESFRDGHFAILFLSPRDCHRVFSPADGVLTRMTHVPGHRLLVHPSHQTADYPVFTLNERLIMELETSQGRLLVIMVAGWGVGNITHPFPVTLRISPRRVSVTELSPARSLQRGDWMATFELGSTAIVLTEKDRIHQTALSRDDVVRYGQALFHTHDGQNAQEAVK